MSMHPDRNLFAEYKNRVMIETGTHRGDGIKLALDAGFEKIYSIDNDPEAERFCNLRFRRDPNIKLFTGDSADLLWDMIKDINEPITFWLDAHSQYLEDEPASPNPWPLLKELELIARHPIKTHTMLIDDILILTHKWTTGWDYEEIKARLYLINPKYKLELFANPVKNNLLVAHV
jgi:hypothetical protein